MLAVSPGNAPGTSGSLDRAGAEPHVLPLTEGEPEWPR
jgi:hypothetical protein